jgi:hypothetical protein
LALKIDSPVSPDSVAAQANKIHLNGHKSGGERQIWIKRRAHTADATTAAAAVLCSTYLINSIKTKAIKNARADRLCVVLEKSMRGGDKNFSLTL